MADLEQIISKKYAVVQFISTKEIEVVPTCWLIDNDHVRWPKKKNSALRSMIQKGSILQEDWTSHEVKIYTYTNSFTNASNKANILLDTSAVSSNSSDDEEQGSLSRKRRRPARFLSSDDQSGDEQQKNTKKKNHSDSRPSFLDCDDDSESIIGEQFHTAKLIENKNTQPSSSASGSRCINELPKKYRIPNPPVQRVERKNAYVHSSKKAGNCVCGDGALAAIITDIYRKMSEMDTKLDSINNKLDTSKNVEPSGLHHQPTEVELPVSTEAGLKDLNDRFKSDKNFSARMIRYLYGAGTGKTVTSFIMSITRRLLSKDVAMNYSRYGRKGKKSFMNFYESMNIILAAAAMKFKELDKDMLSDAFGKVLANASDWDGNSRKAQAVESPTTSLTFED